MRRAVDLHRREQRRPRRARVHPLVVGPRLVFEAQGDVRVARARSDEVGEDPHLSLHLACGDGLGVAARAQHGAGSGAGGLAVFDDRRAVHEHPHDADASRR